MLSVLSAALPQVRALVAIAEALPLAAGQHRRRHGWLRPGTGSSSRLPAQECARVLRPGGPAGGRLAPAQTWPSRGVQELEDPDR